MFTVSIHYGEFPAPSALETAMHCRNMIDMLTRADQIERIFSPDLPGVYEAGIRYTPDTPGQENWFTIRGALKAGRGDCKVLAAWRVADLRSRGIAARPAFGWRIIERPGESMLLIHFFVRYPDGRTEDPSLVLGMPVPDVAGYLELLRVARAPDLLPRIAA